MVLAGDVTPHAIGLGVFLSTVGALCLIIGYLANWLSPFARRHKSRVNKLDDMLDDWVGEPARPGFVEVPGIPQRLKAVEDILGSHKDNQDVLEENVAHLNQKLKRTIEDQLIPLINTVEGIQAKLVLLQDILGERIAPRT